MKKIIFFCLLVILSGCNNSPMDKLKSDKKDAELGKIWSAERQKNSELWKQAAAYCNVTGSFLSYNKKPNCSAVIDEYLESSIRANSKLNAHPINDPFDKK